MDSFRSKWKMVALNRFKLLIRSIRLNLVFYLSEPKMVINTTKSSKPIKIRLKILRYDKNHKIRTSLKLQYRAIASSERNLDTNLELLFFLL